VSAAVFGRVWRTFVKNLLTARERPEGPHTGEGLPVVSQPHAILLDSPPSSSCQDLVWTTVSRQTGYHPRGQGVHVRHRLTSSARIPLSAALDTAMQRPSFVDTHPETINSRW
jgi:hypothetical protein